MSIRLAKITDSSRLSFVFLETASMLKSIDFNDDGWCFLSRGNTSEAFERRLTMDNYFACVYQVGDLIVGYIAMLDNEKIDHMFVLEEHQNKGIAKRLWVYAKEQSLLRGGSGKFWVRSSSQAEAVYQSFGFKRAVEHQTENGISSCLMQLQ